MNVTLAAESIFSIGGFQVTNALFSAVLITVFLIISILLINRGLKYNNPSKGQLGLEMIVSLLYNLVKDILGDVQAKKLFGFLFTFVVFIFASNWFGLIPFVPSIVIKENETAITHEVATVSEKKTPNFGECLKNEEALMSSAKGITELCELAESYAINECTEWFQKDIVTKDMQNLKKRASEFRKIVQETYARMQQAGVAYQDIGHILGRYYNLNDNQGNNQQHREVPGPQPLQNESKKKR